MTAGPDRVRIPLSFDALGLAADAAQLPEEEWVRHFNTRYYEGDWSGVAFRSVGGEAGRLYPDPTASAAFADTPVLDRCPHVRAALAVFPCALLAARFLRLGPGARILEHSDLNLGLEDGEVRVHVPVTTSADVTFLLDGVEVDMAPGDAWYLDLNKRHAVTNDGDHARIHLVVDCIVNDALRALIVGQ